jgi:hypothetical protein
MIGNLFFLMLVLKKSSIIVTMITKAQKVSMAGHQIQLPPMSTIPKSKHIFLAKEHRRSILYDQLQRTEGLAPQELSPLLELEP